MATTGKDTNAPSEPAPQEEVRVQAQTAEAQGTTRAPTTGVLPPGTRAQPPAAGIREGEPVPDAPSTAGMAPGEQVPGTGQTAESAQPVVVPEDPERRRVFQFEVDQPEADRLKESGSPHYQRAGQARQISRELANLVAYGSGDSDRAQALRRDLETLGYVPDDAEAATGSPTPVGRTSRREQQVKTTTQPTGTQSSMRTGTASKSTGKPAETT